MTLAASRIYQGRGGILKGLLSLLALMPLLLVLAWVFLLPAMVASAIRSRTGFGIMIDRLSANPLTARVELHGLILRNPDGYPVEDFVEVRQFKAGVELYSLLGDRLVADEVMLDVPKLTLVRNEQNQLNALEFRDGLLGKEEPAGRQDTGPEKKFLIRHLMLKFDKLVYADHSGKTPSVREYNLRLDRDLHNVTNPWQIFIPLAGGGGASYATGDIFKTSRDTLNAVADILRGSGKKTGETLRGVFELLEEKLPAK
ncbi:MAG: hypothetical protein PHQ04_07685 [Opitutaceae bacterium]|nr:hypothetical protein [Opitutaceae bacterium]